MRLRLAGAEGRLYVPSLFVVLIQIHLFLRLSLTLPSHSITRLNNKPNPRSPCVWAGTNPFGGMHLNHSRPIPIIAFLLSPHTSSAFFFFFLRNYVYGSSRGMRSPCEVALRMVPQFEQFVLNCGDIYNSALSWCTSLSCYWTTTIVH